MNVKVLIFMSLLASTAIADPPCTCQDVYMGCEASLCGTGRRWIAHECSYYLPSGFGCDNVFPDLCTPDPLCLPSCTPNCSCDVNTCNTTTCMDGCGGQCPGIKDCSAPPPFIPPPPIIPPPVPPPPPITPLPPPPVNPCGPGMVCGRLLDGETGTIAIPNTPIQIRNDRGGFFKTVYSDADGNYSVPLTGSLMFVVPIPDRNENVIPMNVPVSDLNPVANFRMYRVPAHIKVSGVRGDFVIVTTSTITGPIPPTIESMGQVSYSSVVGDNNTTTIKVPYGVYWFTCWHLANGSYNKLPSIPAGALKAREEVTRYCQQGV